VAAALLAACGGAGRARDSRAVDPDWVVMLAGAGRAGVRGLAALPDGGAVAVGGFDGELAAGRVRLASAGAGDGFAVGLSPAGAVSWGVALAGAGDQELTAVAAGAGLAVAGTSGGAAVLAGRAVEVTGQPGAVVARVDGSGAPLWQKSISATGYAVPAALAWTGDGDLVVAGYFAGTLDPAGAALHGAGSQDVWVARLAGADGRVMWMHRAGGPGPDAARAIAVADGGIVVAGSFHRWADFSSTTLRSADESADPFLARVGPGGFAWARALASEGAAVAQALVAAPGGRLAAAINFDGSLQVRDKRVEASRERGSGMVALFDMAGQPTGAGAMNGAGSADALVLAGEEMFVAGEAAGSGGYLAAVSPDGRLRWVVPIAGQSVPAALAAGRDGVLVGGSAHGRLGIGRSAAAVAGESDGFVARIPSD